MSSFKTYRRMLGFMKPYVFIFIISSLLTFFIVSLEGISIWFLGTLPNILFNPDTQVIARPEFSINNINEMLKYWTYQLISVNKGLNKIMFVCILIAIAFTLKNALLYINKILIIIIHSNVGKDVRNVLYKHVLLLPVSYHDKNQSGKAISLIINDITLLNNSVTTTLNSLIIEPLRLIFFISLLIIINAKLTLIVFIIYPILGLLIVKIGQSVKRRSSRELQSFSDLVSVLTETISNIRIVKMFNTSKPEYEKFRNENAKYIKKYMRSERMRIVLSPLTETIAMYVTALLLFYGGNAVLSTNNSFTAEDFIRFLFVLVSSYQPWKSIGGVNSAIQGGIAAAERIFSRLNMTPEKIVPNSHEHVPRFEKSIRFNNVSFQYPGYDEVVLQDISFSIDKGEVLAIVGSSGAGKTTILDILPRFYEIKTGEVLIDDTDYRQFELAGLRDLFGIVSQESILFNDTVLNNIAYGSETISLDKAKESAEAANASEFIAKLPEGYNTVIGERGVTLSGGQRQRLAIARALYKDPQILILDEATSALDTESERLVQKAIDKLITNRTSFVVAHRLSTIQHANKIIVLENGAIVEQGTHEELLALGNRYKYFYDIQFSAKNV